MKLARGHEFEIATCGMGGDVEPRKCAEAQAAHAREFGQVEDERLCSSSSE